MALDVSRLGKAAWEKEYLLQVFDHLPDLKAVAFHGWSGKDLVMAAPKVDNETILVMVSNERHQDSPKVTCRLLLRQYDARDGGFPLPLGLKNHFPLQPPKPVAERKYDVTFVGNGYAGRSRLVAALKDDPRFAKLKAYVSVQKTTIAAYAELLYESRIGLCPRGVISPESFRFFETLRAGAVPVCPKYADNWIYRNHSGVTIHPYDHTNAKGILDAVERLLADPAGLQARSDAAVQLWATRYDPAAVAARIRSLLAITG